MKRVLVMLLAVGLVYSIGICAEEGKRDTKPWTKENYFVHDENEPRPAIIRAGKTASDAPTDAIVLFDGTNMDAWVHDNQDPKKPKWKIIDGFLTSADKAGYIGTKQGFGSFQLHIEWKTPEKVVGTSQGRGNSGIFLMGTYEIQVLDCWQKSTEKYDNPTYADGQASAVYGQKPPLVNASRGPGVWQSYDIIFHRPIFKGRTNEVVRPATVTVLHNGVLTQDHWEIKGVTWHKRMSEYQYHADKMPLKIQDHGNPVQFKNIWIRELAD